MVDDGFYGWASRRIRPRNGSQIRSEACGWEQTPRYLIRDLDGAYGEIFIRRLRSMGIRDRPTSPRSPWQNGCAERLINTSPTAPTVGFRFFRLCRCGSPASAAQNHAVCLASVTYAVASRNRCGAKRSGQRASVGAKIQPRRASETAQLMIRCGRQIGLRAPARRMSSSEKGHLREQRIKSSGCRFHQCKLRVSQTHSPVSKHSMTEMVSQVTVFLNCSIARAVGALVGGQK